MAASSLLRGLFWSPASSQLFLTAISSKYPMGNVLKEMDSVDVDVLTISPFLRGRFYIKLEIFSRIKNRCRKIYHLFRISV